MCVVAARTVVCSLLGIGVSGIGCALIGGRYSPCFVGDFDEFVTGNVRWEGLASLISFILR